jgi:hypothetical protein
MISTRIAGVASWDSTVARAGVFSRPIQDSQTLFMPGASAIVDNQILALTTSGCSIHNA